MNVRDLAIKFTSYAHYILSREWAREGSQLPVLVCIAPDIAQERRMQRVAQVCLAHASGLVLWTTTDVPLHEQGPLAPIWLEGILSPITHYRQGVHTDKACLIRCLESTFCEALLNYSAVHLDSFRTNLILYKI
jgi:hypothetical protein